MRIHDILFSILFENISLKLSKRDKKLKHPKIISNSHKYH